MKPSLQLPEEIMSNSLYVVKFNLTLGEDISKLLYFVFGILPYFFKCYITLNKFPCLYFGKVEYYMTN